MIKRKEVYTGEPPEISHAQLVSEAFRWLKYIDRNTVVFKERVASTTEIPDAIGFRGTSSFSTLIECKASRPDFLADKKKLCRRMPESGMGSKRYFMAPMGLIKPGELPKNWGLLEVGEVARKYRKIIETVEANPFYDRDREKEISYLVSAIRRIDVSMAVFIESNL